MMSLMSSIGERVRALRKARDMTQMQLSAASGLDQSTLSAIERGAGFTAETLMALADCLGVDPVYLMRGQATPQEHNQLVSLFTRLQADDQRAVLKTMRALAIQAETDFGGLDEPPAYKRPERRKSERH